MDAWNRFHNSIIGRPIDHPPLALIGTNRFYASLWNAELFDVFHDPRKMIDLQIRTFKRFPQITFIPGAWPDYGAGILSSFGCQIVWQKNTMPQVAREAFHTAEEINNFRIPDPRHDGFMPWYLQTLRMFLEQADALSGNLHFLWSFGPGELASYLWGTTNFLGDLIQKPDLCEILLEKAAQAIIVWLRAQNEVNPSADAILLTDDISGLLSEPLYRKCLWPFQQKVIQAFPDHLIVFHNDTKSNHILQAIKELGVDVFNLGKTTNLELAAQVLGNEVSLMGNLDPLDLLIHGSENDIITEARKCFSQVKNSPRYILSAGGGLNEGTPSSSLEALVTAVEKGGLL
jgi:uroporphyrinogen decarboxylase